MNAVLAFLWLAVIGTNLAQNFSTRAPYAGAVILSGFVYFTFIYRRHLLRLLLFKDYLFFLLLLAAPVILMLSSDRSFVRGDWTDRISILMVFVVSSVLAARMERDQTVPRASLTIVAVAVALNLYEFFIKNNVWSVAPGRSAGLYVNPNVSGEALVGYGLLCLLYRSRSMSAADFMITVLILVGVFSTFSRTATVAALVMLSGAIVMRAKRRHLPRIALGIISAALFVWLCTTQAAQNRVLSKDAQMRVTSLFEAGGVGDYRRDRGAAAQAALVLIEESPILGNGVMTSLQMPEGPHNMFLSVLLDYGIFGLFAYLFIILRLAVFALRTDEKAPWLLFFVLWIVVFSLASHNLLDSVTTMPLFGFALARASLIRSSRRIKEIKR